MNDINVRYDIQRLLERKGAETMQVVGGKGQV